jgi:hypothetical protein
MNTFPCTPTIEEGTLALRKEAEFRTDKDLYHVIRLQQIIERIDKVSTLSGSDEDVQSAYLCVRSDLEKFRIHMSSDVSDSRKSSQAKPINMCCPVRQLSICSRPSLYAVSHRQALLVSGRIL